MTSSLLNRWDDSDWRLDLLRESSSGRPQIDEDALLEACHSPIDIEPESLFAWIEDRVDPADRALLQRHAAISQFVLDQLTLVREIVGASKDRPAASSSRS